MHGYITPAYLADDTSIWFPPGDPSSDRNIRNLCPYSWQLPELCHKKPNEWLLSYIYRLITHNDSVASKYYIPLSSSYLTYLISIVEWRHKRFTDEYITFYIVQFYGVSKTAHHVGIIRPLKCFHHPVLKVKNTAQSFGDRIGTVRCRAWQQLS
jgi:hypothetical protein